MARKGYRAGLTVGVALLLAGLAVLGYVAWQFWGTNVVAAREHRRVTTAIEHSWAQRREATSVHGVGLLRIPRFGRSFQVPIVRGFGADALARGVAMDPQGAEPGQLGNLVLAGHRVTHGEPFRRFPDLRAGDTVIVETRTHVYTYRLRNSGRSITVDFTTHWPLWSVPDPDGSATARPGERLVTLLTCSEIFHTDHRQVAIGELIRAVGKH